MMWKVYIGNLDSRIKEIELADEFRPYGTVRSVWVARNPPGYGFIEFDNRRDAEDAVSGLDGRHGWRVEMSHKSVGGSGRSRGSHGSESKCYDCGASGHFARECRYRGSRHSYRRSPSPHSRSTSRRDSFSRLERDDARSRHDRSSPFDDRASPPKKRRERSRSRESDVSESRGPRHRRRDPTNSPLHEKSDSPKREELEGRRSSQDNRIDTRGVSPPKKRRERSRSRESDVSDSRGPRHPRRELTNSPLHEKTDIASASPKRKKDSSSTSSNDDRIDTRGINRIESETNTEDRSVSSVSNSPPKESERSRSPCDGISDTDGSVPLEHSKPLQPNDSTFLVDGQKSPPKNGCTSGSSPEEDKDGYYKERSPVEEIKGEQHNGNSS